MDPAELVLRYLQALLVLVWPATVLVALFLFRASISEFIRNLRKIQGPGGISAEADPRQTIDLLNETLDKFAKGIIDQIDGRLGDKATISREVTQVVKDNFVQCDVAPIFYEFNERLVPMPYDANMQLSTFVDRFYTTALHNHVPFASYGIYWQFRAADSGQPIFHQYHKQRLAESDPMVRTRFWDTRTLQEVGIQPGTLLVAEPIVRFSYSP
jgi:hypothetical protein